MTTSCRFVELADLVANDLARECRLANRLRATVAVVALGVDSGTSGQRAASLLDAQMRESDVLAVVDERRLLVVVYVAPDAESVLAATRRSRMILTGGGVIVTGCGVATFPDDHQTPAGLLDLALRRMAGSDRSRGPTAVEPNPHRTPPEASAVDDRGGTGGLWRSFEVAFSVAVLLLTLPLLLLSWAAVKLTSRGPALFVQERAGLHGRGFPMYKFRTMVVDAEAQLPALLASSDVCAHQKMDNDPRVTPVGRVLRKLSLDELPQLWNVVRGDMSLVGPRPTSKPSDDHAAWELERLTVKPGLTGPWQVYHRGQLSFADRARLDIRYARHRSTARDLRLLMATIPAVVTMRGRH